MITFDFLPPTGPPIPSARTSIIEATLLNRDLDYWEGGSGDAGIHESGTENKLIFHFVDERGFCVVHETSDHEIPKVLVSDGSLDQSVRVRLSGNEMEVPLGYFVSPNQALEAAKLFVDTGSPLAAGAWIDFSPTL